MSLPNRAEAHGDFIPDTSNQRLLRNALGCFNTGVTIVTAATSSGPAAITANSFASVSLTPPLVLWSVDRSSARLDTFTHAQHFSIHILNAHQETLCMEVARDPTRLQSMGLMDNEFGVPVLSDYLVRFDCSLEALHTAGDHVIIVGKVNVVSQSNCECELANPLAFYRGRTGSFTPNVDDTT